MRKDFFLGFVKIHILYHAQKGDVYGSWLIEELAEHGYRLSPGTLYPILHNLEANQYLDSYKQNVRGKLRKYYRLTSAGLQALHQAKLQIRQLVDEVLK